MLYEIMLHIRNFFIGDFEESTFTITEGTLSTSVEGKYFLIEGSKYNDGVYENLEGLTDETFTGRVTAVNPPTEFLKLAEEIKNYVESSTQTPYTSESFGGYSYTKATNSNGGLISWQGVFRERLNTWRKI